MSGAAVRKVLVTGATGCAGSATLRALLRRGLEVRAGSRYPEKIPPEPGLEAVRLEYLESETIAAALVGVDAVVVIVPPYDASALMHVKPLIDVAAAREQHAVLLSMMGAEQEESSPLRIVERHLTSAGRRYSLVRANFFMENFLREPLLSAVQSSTLAVPAGEARVSFVSAIDVGESIAAVIEGQRYGKTYTLTGPRGLDFGQLAWLFTEACGRPVSYHPIRDEEMASTLRRARVRESSIECAVAIYRAIRSGWASAVTRDVEDLTGLEPLSFRDFLAENAESWKKPPSLRATIEWSR